MLRVVPRINNLPVDDWHRVGQRARERREELGLSQEKVGHDAGVSAYTIRLIEKGERGSFRAATMRAVSTALGWDPGAIEAIRQGKEPGDAIDAYEGPALGLEERMERVERRVQKIFEMVSRIDAGSRGAPRP